MSEESPIQKNVFAAGEFRVEAGTQLQQGRDLTTQEDPTACRDQHARDDLEERALAGAIAADDPEDLPAVNIQADIRQRQEVRKADATLQESDGILLERAHAFLRRAIPDVDILEANHDFRLQGQRGVDQRLRCDK